MTHFRSWRFPPILALASVCLLALIFWCFGGVLLGHQQFGFRDAAQYNYPMFERIQHAWARGSVPLWEPGENAGFPQLAMATAAVFYPGKLIYAAAPSYAWGARLYVIFHVALAFATMLALLRSWSISWTGSSIGALAFAFGMPVLSQYCNVVYLVGAAWTPLGILCADQWLRLRRLPALGGLAAVLTMQVLGGDPQAAYVLGVCAAGYGVALGWPASRARTRPSAARFLAAALALTVVWSLAALSLAWIAPRSSLVNATRDVMPRIVLAISGAGVLGFLIWSRKRQARALPMLLGLLAAAVIALLMCAVVIIPAGEFLARSQRVALGGLHDIYLFSVEPLRIVEFFWPNVSGSLLESTNTLWLPIAMRARSLGQMWTPSLYVGGLAIILAMSAFGFRGGPPWRAWLSAMTVVGLLGSLGSYTSPIWLGRLEPSIAAQIGPHDPENAGPARADRALRDGDGSFYWAIANTLPGFRQFRYPGKLLTITVLGIAGLAGFGWDRALAGERRRAPAAAAIACAIGLALLVVTSLWREQMIAAFSASPQARAPTIYGPFDAQGAVDEISRGLLHGTLICSLTLILILCARRWPRSASLLALVALTADLGLANARHIITVPQAVFDAVPSAAERIARAEANSPESTPFRVQRLPLWPPTTWYETASPERAADIVAWERDTLQPKHGLNHAIDHTYTRDAVGLYEFRRFFETSETSTTSGESAFPRRAFDLWNTRYFVTTNFPDRLRANNRDIAAIFADTQPLDPLANDDRGMLILKNMSALPRAWVVHALYEHDARDIVTALRETGPGAFDPRTSVWLDPRESQALAPFLAGGTPSSGESVAIVRCEPERVELLVTLERPGVVVFADVHYPGWRLRIDDVEAPIQRVNLLMRGAAVTEGRHRLVYSYEPLSFRIGAVLSLAGVATLLVFMVWSCRARIRRPAPARDHA